MTGCVKGDLFGSVKTRIQGNAPGGKNWAGCTGKLKRVRQKTCIKMGVTGSVRTQLLYYEVLDYNTPI